MTAKRKAQLHGNPPVEPVDVIIPTYNGLPYLKQTIDSVLTQTYDNLHVYVIDDGSTDNSATKKYVESITDPRLHYAHKANGGQATARNYGIRISSSPFVTFVDSDDIWYPNKLEEQLACFNHKPLAGMVYGYSRLIDASGNPNKARATVAYDKRGYLFKYLLKGNKISGSASMAMVRREVFDKIGLFKEDFLIGEDWEMWLRIARSYEIDYVPKFLVGIRILDTGMQQNHLKIARGLDYMLPILIEEFRLGPLDKAIIGTTCLSQACVLYFKGGDRKAARTTFFAMLRYNPLAMFSMGREDWLICLRIVFGNNWLRSVRRKLSTNYRQREAEEESIGNNRSND